MSSQDPADHQRRLIVDEANEHVKEIVKLKDEVIAMSMQMASASSGTNVEKLRSELIAEKKSH